MICTGQYGTIENLQAGDRVYRWVWTGGDDADLQTLTVIRVNRVTVTVKTDAGTVLRIPPRDITGRVDWDEN